MEWRSPFPKIGRERSACSAKSWLRRVFGGSHGMPCAASSQLASRGNEEAHLLLAVASPGSHVAPAVLRPPSCPFVSFTIARVYFIHDFASRGSHLLSRPPLSCRHRP